MIERNAARELQLVDDLLTMAFLDDNRLRIQRAPIDLAEVARRVVEDAALRARERGLALRWTPARAARRSSATSTGWCRWSRTWSPTR